MLYGGIEHRMTVSFFSSPSRKKPKDALPFERSALAFAEALIPGSARIPAADEKTVALTDETVAMFHPVLKKAWRVAQGTLDAAAVAQKGKPFSALPAETQEVLIRRWEHDPFLRTPLSLVSLIYRFVHFDRPHAYAALGGSRTEVKNLEQPRWLQQVHRAEEWAGDDGIECDVVVIGTGAGGGVVGRELADRGYAVVFVEEGEHYRRDAFGMGAIDAHHKFYRGALSLGNVAMPVFMGRLVGGSTAINGGTCFRTPPWILDRWCEDLGTSEFTSDAMAKHFARVEDVLEVAPTEHRYIGPISGVMERGCNALGWHHFAINRNAPGCNGSGFCDFGCRTGAKKGTDLGYVPPALERGSLLVTGLRADRVLLEGGRAVGIEGFAKNGRAIRVRAKKVILAGGAIPTPLFLLKQGIGNRSEQVGRNLAVQPSTGFSALFDDEINGKNYVPQGYGCDEFLREGLLMMTAQADVNLSAVMFPFSGHRLMQLLEALPRVAQFALLVRDELPNGRVWRDVGGLPAITYNVKQKDAERMHRLMTLTAEMCIEAGARSFYPVNIRWPILEDKRAFERFRKYAPTPGDIIWTSYHPMGTCKMGRDPKTSVVGLDHQVHDVPGLYVVDASTVPTALGVNPQLTIMAMATRAAEKIADALG